MTELSRVPIVQDFLHVFPKEFLGVPPERLVEFWIDLMLGSALIAKASYRLEPLDLQELSTQPQDLLDRGFICLSSSPWGAQILFVKK